MDTQTISLLILGIGVILVVLSLFLRRDDRSRRADRGGVVVGGDSHDTIEGDVYITRGSSAGCSAWEFYRAASRAEFGGDNITGVVQLYR